MGKRAQHFRDEAERCRKLAKAIGEVAGKQHMLDVARQYEKLADEADAKS